ncbi:hypothetical protein [Streptomyces sp. LN704]|uniref:hypothetical protein n=1 Tax=Streptomyces sp. LN704 TaxID=3112982 RepID=UPI0037150D50
MASIQATLPPDWEHAQAGRPLAPPLPTRWTCSPVTASGASPGWAVPASRSFAVEYGDAVGPTATGLGAVSAGGVEAVDFRLRPPRADVLHGQLPLFIVREAPERARRPPRPLG